MRKVKFTNAYGLDIILTEKDAVNLLRYLVEENAGGNPEFYYEDTGELLTVGTAYIPELFSTTEFWDESNGDEIADRYGIKEIGKRYYFTEEEYNKLKAELEENPYWKIWNESYGHYEYNIRLDLWDSNDCL